MNNRYLVTNNLKKFNLYQRNIVDIRKIRPQFKSKNEAIKNSKLIFNNDKCIYICMIIREYIKKIMN